MSLEYKILWIDDKIEEFLEDDFEEKLKSYIESHYFIPHLDFCKNLNEAEKKILTKKYDIIFSDYNIDEDKNGDDFIQSIREKNINTEILFYSGNNYLPQRPFNRVTYFTETPPRWHEKLLVEMKNLISITVEKLNSLSSIRGLVISEVSDLDGQMENIIRKYYGENPTKEKRKTFDVHIIKELEKSTRKKLNCNMSCKHKWYGVPIHKIIGELSFDSSQKAKTINLIISELKFPYSATNINFNEDYRVEINEVRNSLAHCSSEYDENGNEILVTRKENIIFTQEKFSEIRKNILKYQNIFSELEKMVG